MPNSVFTDNCNWYDHLILNSPSAWRFDRMRFDYDKWMWGINTVKLKKLHVGHAERIRALRGIDPLHRHSTLTRTLLRQGKEPPAERDPSNRQYRTWE